MSLQALSERSAALCVGGLLLLTPPLLLVADHSATAFGIPVFYAYIFVCWGLLIGGNVLLARRLTAASDETDGQAQE